MKSDTFLDGGSVPPTDTATRRNLRDRLRGETRDLHELLDRRFEGMHAAETPDGYHRFILMNAACHDALEALLGKSPLTEAFPDWSSRDRSAHLARDIAAMGLSKVQAAPFPIAEPDLAEAIGIAYVLEGSRLGGRYILRLVRERRGDPAWASTSLHYLESTDEPDRFRDFTMRASALLVDDADIAKTLAAANAAFGMFAETETAIAGSQAMATGAGRRAS